ncbi:MAG TPA: DoxX family protein [Myxococcota bacterium]|nr:DoxX family protein [Myxococcota bacterium]
MESALSKIGWAGHAALRIVSGFLFACHGAQKVFGAFGGVGEAGGSAPIWSQFWIAGIIEIVGGTLIALGVRTQIAAFVCCGEMAVAYFSVHQKGGLLPIQNHGELAVLYCFVFLFLATNGGGPLSLERGGR